MKKETKYYIIGGAVLALVTFLGFAAFAKPKKKPVPVKKKTGTVIVDEPTGGFTLPAEVTTRVGTRLRKSASTSSSILYTYESAGKKLGVLDDSMESDGQWFKVSDGNRSGWVRADVVDYQIRGASNVGSDYEDEECPAWYGMNVCP